MLYIHTDQECAAGLGTICGRRENVPPLTFYRGSCVRSGQSFSLWPWVCASKQSFVAGSKVYCYLSHVHSGRSMSRWFVVLWYLNLKTALSDCYWNKRDILTIKTNYMLCGLHTLGLKLEKKVYIKHSTRRGWQTEPKVKFLIPVLYQGAFG
jgi:hypothetical protein